MLLKFTQNLVRAFMSPRRRGQDHQHHQNIQLGDSETLFAPKISNLITYL